MKVLTTEQQVELQTLIDYLSNNYDNELSIKSQLNYWSIELKPKRVRRKNIMEVLPLPVDITV